ncbi:mitochondrial carrier domain-containing protein [Blastocladiella britannica]|nr:mitochondrial carrier domain-containing protein [Blastocladiella britannica]
MSTMAAASFESAPDSVPRGLAAVPGTALAKPARPSIAGKLVSGSIAGLIGTTIIYPIDMVKSRLQNQTNSQYKGIVDCFRQIVRTESARGLYRGMSANLIGIIPEKAIKLTVNDLARYHFAGRLGLRDADALPVQWGMLAGGMAGFFQVIATAPMERVKIVMQLAAVDSANARRPLAQVVSEMGIRGMYKGTVATWMRDVPFSILFFPSHALFKSLAADEHGKVSFGAVFGSGILAGWLAAGAVTPSDVIKTRLQAADGAKYRGIRHCFTEIVSKEGPGALFKGMLPRCMIVSPLFGITLLVYEVQQRYLAN